MNFLLDQRRWMPAALVVIALVALAASSTILFSDVQNGDDASSPVDDFQSFSPEPSLPADHAEAPLDLAVDDLLAYDDTDTWRHVDWQHLADDDQWEALEPRDEPLSDDVASEPPSTDAATSTGSSRQDRLRDGRIVIVTNFTRAEVLINGEPYPSYSDDGSNPGMAVAPNETHEIYVEFDGNSRIYEVQVRPGERRLMMIELTGMGETTTERPARRAPRRPEGQEPPDVDDENAEDGEGRITVYSRPRGDIYVGGQDMDEQTPGTVDIEAGRHEVQVEYADGQMSETKTVRVREGSRVKLFFRQEDE